MSHRLLFLVPVLALAACNSQSKPEGQVLATVNGREITRSELNAALPKLPNGSDNDTATVRNAVLDELVMRELVSQEARRQALDKSQAYLIASKRSDDQILSDLLSRRIVQSLRPPYAKNADAFVRANPTRFGARTLLQVDQVRFPSGSVPGAALVGLKSIAELLQVLDKAKVKSERGRATLDSLTLTPEAYRQLVDLPAGQPFVVNENGLTLVSVINGRQSAPVTGDAANRLALQQLQQDAERTALVKQLQVLRQSAKIKYQAGFAPPKTPPVASASSTPAPAPAR